MKYYVGNERILVNDMPSAYRIAVELMKDKKLGDSVNIYSSSNKSRVEARVEVRPGKDRVLRYVAYFRGNKYGHALTLDYQAKGERFLNIYN